MTDSLTQAMPTHERIVMIRRRSIRVVVPAAALLAGAFAFGLAPAAWAEPAPQAGYGQHVAQCATTMGFSGDMNPGMHHGRSGWTGAECAAADATAP